MVMKFYVTQQFEDGMLPSWRGTNLQNWFHTAVGPLLPAQKETWTQFLWWLERIDIYQPELFNIYRWWLILISFSFVINLFTWKFLFLRFERGLPNVAITQWDFNIETLVTFHLKAHELLYTPHSFTSREFVLFTCTNTLLSCFRSDIVY